MARTDVDLLIDFLNTIDLEAGTDLLDDPRAFSDWCAIRDTRPGDVRRSRTVRDALRRAATSAPDATEPMPHTALDATLGPAGVTVHGSDAAGAALAAASRLTATGEWNRIKICPGDDCGEAFFDHSRNKSRVWCDMAVCGNVSKVRTIRRRRGNAG